MAKRSSKMRRAPKALRDDKIPVAWLKQLMQEFLQEREWQKYHLPRNLAASIAVEAAELLELFQWLTPEEARKRCEEDPAFRRHVGEEMADVLMYCISLANALNFDIAQTVAAKMEKNRKKYPADAVRGNYVRKLED